MWYESKIYTTTRNTSNYRAANKCKCFLFFFLSVGVTSNFYICDDKRFYLFVLLFLPQYYFYKLYTVQQMKFSRKLQIWSHLLKKSLMENFLFCVVVLEFILSILLFKASDYLSFNLLSILWLPLLVAAVML